MRSTAIRIGVLCSLLLASVAMGGAARASVQFDLQTIKTEPTPLETGQYADIWVKVRNRGDMAASDANLTFVPRYPFSVDADEKTTWQLGTVTSGEEYRLHLQVRVDENAVTGNNSLVFRTQSGNSDVTVTHKVPVEVRTADEALVVEKTFFPDTVAPGAQQQMTLQLRNLGDGTVKNTDVALDVSADSLPFATIGTTRQHVQRLGAGERRNVSFTLRMADDADIGVYKLPITLSYENPSGTAFETGQQTGVVIGGTPNIAVAMDSTTVQQAGKAGTVTLRIVNRGDGRARFVSMELLDDSSYTLQGASSVYLGNMAPDDYQTAEFTMYAEEDAPQLSIPVNISYRDARAGDRQTTQTVRVQLFSGSELRKFTSGDSGMLPYLAGVLLVLLVGGGYWWRRR